MLDEENDKRIKEAADHYHPAYDDTAWEKMEKMLDEHLPQEKGRKKIFFLLPFLLLMGGVIFFMVSDNQQNHSSEVLGNSGSENISGKSNTTNSSSANSPEVSINIPLKDADKDHGTSEKNKGGLQMIPGNSQNAITENTSMVPVSSMNNKRNKRHNYKENLPVGYKILLKQGSSAEKNNVNEIVKNETAPSSPDNEFENNIEPQKTRVQSAFKNITEIKKQDTISKIENTQSEIIKKKTKSNNSFKNNFGITFSAGPDISGVHINNAGKFTITYGAGLSYSISKKFTVRSGFYISKKIYSVDPDDYQMPSGSIINYDYLNNINANCNVYEIPIKVNYSFGKVKNHNWFVSTGISSYLMKKESYNYYYKTPAGETYNKDWTINNKNKNYFSVLDLSGGYQYSFNNRFSIMAEPYINLPLSGVGAGKVKLNSGGILFTLTVNPFLKNQK